MIAKERYTGIQTILQNCGNNGCLFLSICSIAEEQKGTRVDLIECIKTCLARGWITEQFYVKDSLAILNYLTNKMWFRGECRELPSVIKGDQYVVAIYYNKRTGFTHFRRRAYDTLKDSVTVKEGVIIGYYIYSYGR